MPEKLTIYHNPQCRKSRAGLQYLKDKGVDCNVVEYIREPLTVEKIERLLVKLNMVPEELLRTQEEYYKKQLKGKRFEAHELLKIMTENPRLIRRPIVEGRVKAVIGDPTENIDRVIR